MPPAESRIMYQVVFHDYNGRAHRLDTIDPAKIGPWLAEMFMIWPFRVDMNTGVQIEHYHVQLPGR